MRLRILQKIALSLLVTGLLASVSFGQNTGLRATNRQVETLLIRIETKIDILKDEVQRFAERNGNADADTLSDNLVTLEQSSVKLHESFDARDPLKDGVNEVLTDATEVDRFFTKNRVSPAAQAQWRSLKRDFTTLSTYNRVRWNWNQPVRPMTPITSTPTAPAYTVSESQMRTLLSRIDLKTGIYKSQMNTELKDNTTADLSNEAISSYISNFETATSRLKQRFDSRQSASADASDVLTRATYIDQFMTRNAFNSQTQAQWRNLKSDLNTLASYYRLSWNWNQSLPDNTGSNGGGGLRNFDARITGTYRLNTNLSEDPTTAINRALNSSSQADREESRINLERRLRSPDMIAIEKNNKTVSLASSILPQVTFQADGVARSETNARGRTVTTTATVDEDGLIINYQGERASDFYLTFLPTNDGKLKVTRRIYLDNSSEGITVSSIYDKIDNVARWTSVSNGNNVGEGGVPATINDAFIVPSGTRISAELTNTISGSPVTDRFTMQITSPGQYRGNIISGRVLAEDANSRVSGRTRVLLAFDTIRLRDGKTYRFNGNIDAVTAVNGDIIEVSNQAPVRATNQAPRGAGGILGALIGAIAGVPVNSAGTSASVAGSILVQPGDAINLGSGSQVTITATTLVN